MLPRRARELSSLVQSASGFLARGIAAALIASTPVFGQDGLPAGAGFVTGFSGQMETVDAAGATRTVIDPDGITGRALDLSQPMRTPTGAQWQYPEELFSVRAAQTGQIFGVAIDNALEPNVYATATAAFGLHRTAGNTAWMSGMWGADGGPGTVYRLTARNGYAPEVFARITLDGRPNSGAALGNIAYDDQHMQFFVSDLETGMIHRLRLADGFDLGRYDHGMQGRVNFLDAATGSRGSLMPKAFDSASAARIATCETGDFSADPTCWNLADFRRRVWGLDVRTDPTTGQSRLYYAIWGSEGFGAPDFDPLSPDARNSVWSVGLTDGGDFDPSEVRREFILPGFSDPDGAAGPSRPVTDITFPNHGDRAVMLLAERGGIRNLGLDTPDAFATPFEARVLRYVLAVDGAWQPDGRYDVGYADRAGQGQPYIRAAAAGGVAFGAGYDVSGALDPAQTDGFVWMTGDGLCLPEGPCRHGAGALTDTDPVHGLQGGSSDLAGEVAPAAAFAPYPATGPATPPTGPDASYMIDTDLGAEPGNGATWIGDIAVLQPAPSGGYNPWYPPAYPPGDLPPGDEFGEDDPELGIEKVGDTVCDWGGECHFRVTVTNNGPGIWDAPILVGDFIPFESEVVMDLVAWSAGWTCDALWAESWKCTHDRLVLGPGAGVILGLTFEIREPGADFVVPEDDFAGMNCAIVEWPATVWDAVPEARIYYTELALAREGVFTEVPDPVYDADTQAAIDVFRAANAMPPGGIDDALLAALYPDGAGMPGDADPTNDESCAAFIVPGEPLLRIDLGVEKTAAEPVCAVGEVCRFHIEVTNHGDTAYVGPIVLRDHLNSEFHDIFWDAVVATSPDLVCDWAACHVDGAGAIVTLAPGDSRTFWIDALIPEDAAYRDGRWFSNWVGFVWDDMEHHPSDDPTNDEDDAFVDLIKPISLGIEKERDGGCGPGDFCDFLITVTNVGHISITEPMAIRDFADEMWAGGGRVDVPLDLRFIDGAVAIGCGDPTGGEVRCTFTPIPGDPFEPGDSFTFRVGFTWPDDLRSPDSGITELRNCADVDWGEMDWVAGDDDPGDDLACDTVAIMEVHQRDLQIEKAALSDWCERGAECEFEVTVTNASTIPYTGRLIFSEYAGTQDPGVPGPMTRADALTSLSPDLDCPLGSDDRWHCAIGGSPAPDITLAAGESRTFRIVTVVPEEPGHLELRNYVSLEWPYLSWTGDADASNDQDHVIVPLRVEVVPLRPALRITKTLADDGCFPGAHCAFDIAVENTGAVPVAGPIGVRDVVSVTWLEPPLAPVEVVGAICTPDGDGRADCVFNADGAEVLDPGETYSARIGFLWPADLLPAAGVEVSILENCAHLAWEELALPDGGLVETDYTACVPIAFDRDDYVVFDSDLDFEVIKAGPATCLRGEDCVFGVTIVNHGPDPFSGTLWLGDTWVEVFGAGDATVDPGIWQCDTLTDSSLLCTLTGDGLDAGDRVGFSITWPVGFDTPVGESQNCAGLVFPNAGDVARSVGLAQTGLNRAGFDLEITNVLDDATITAIADFRAAEGLPPGAGIDDALWSALFPRAENPAGDRDDRNNLSCLDVAIVDPAPIDFDLGVRSQTECTRGTACTAVHAWVENFGKAPFDGPVGFSGDFDPAVSVLSVASADGTLLCAAGEAEYQCLGSGLHFDPGERSVVDITLDIPADFGPDVVQHHKAIIWVDPALADANPDNDEDTAPIDIVDPPTPDLPDLALAKTASQGSCNPGAQCAFSLSVSNVGTTPYAGTVTIADTLSEDWGRLSAYAPADWRCTGGGTQTRCTLADAALAPGETRWLSLTFTTGAGAQGVLTNCAELAWAEPVSVRDVQAALNAAGFDAGAADGIAGPRTQAALRAFQRQAGVPETGAIDRVVLERLLGLEVPGDADPANDRACSEVPLVAPVTPAPPPQTQPPQTQPPRTQPQDVEPQQDPAGSQQTLQCPAGWRPVRNPVMVPVLIGQGHQITQVQGGGRTLICSKPPANVQRCPAGYRSVTRAEAKALAGQVQVKQVGNLLCVPR